MSSKVIVTIFGASGDLAKRKLYPSLFRLYKSGNLSEHFAVIGTARRPWSKEYFESVVVESILDLADSTEQAQEFASHFYYQSHDVNDTEHYIALRQLQAELNEKYQDQASKETQKNTNKVLPIWSMFSIETIPNVTNSRHCSKIQPGIPKKWRKCVAKQS